MENMSGDGKTSPFGNGMGDVSNASSCGVPCVTQVQKTSTSIVDQGSAPSSVAGGPGMAQTFAPYPSAPSAGSQSPFTNLRG